MFFYLLQLLLYKSIDCFNDSKIPELVVAIMTDQFLRLLLLVVYSPFSDRVGLPLDNITSPFLLVIDVFSRSLVLPYVDTLLVNLGNSVK